MPMIAMTVPHAGGGFERVEREVPVPGRGELLIDVDACGVCHSDALTVEGSIPGIEYPRIPGHEVTGRIGGIGEGVAGWRVGDRAGVGWFGGACGSCANCRRGASFACQTRREMTGVTRDGGYATHLVADASAVAHLPADLDQIAAAPLLCAGLTTFTALRECGAKPGELVAVHGIGGLGHLGIQFAHRLGFRVVAVGRGRDKEALARSLGTHEYIDSEDNDVAAALLVMGGARAIIATSTSADAMASVVDGLGVNGTMMVLGAVGSFPIDTLTMLGKRAAVKAWYSGVPADAEDAIGFSRLSDVCSMNEVYPLEKTRAAYDRMMSGEARFRVVLAMR